jgi:hypothetical protein
MAAAPIISISRGGALIAIGEMLGALSLLLIAERRKNKWFYLGVGALFTAMLVFAGYLGWAKLEARLEKIFTDDLSGRIEIYENSGQMIEDFWVLGSGPKTFGALYQLYRTTPAQSWAAYLHDDWQETLITFGIFGVGFLLFALLLVVFRWWLPGPGIPSHWLFPALVWLALVGCLAHAKFDFPFQIYSVLFLFLLLGTMSFSMTRQAQG